MLAFPCRDSLRFSFMHIIQKELDSIVHRWNTHRIRRNAHSTSSGIPDEMYLLPHLNGYGLHYTIISALIRILPHFDAGTRDYKVTVHAHSLRYAEQYTTSPPPPVSLEYLRAARLIMAENSITYMPQNIMDALHLYLVLVTTLETYTCSESIMQNDMMIMTTPIICSHIATQV